MTGSPHLARLAPLDGLRGLAALAVVLEHFVVHLGLLPWAPMGGIGVLVFFVLSGYLIASVCSKLEASAGGYLAFLRRRVVRLAPVNLAVVLVVPAALVLLDGLAGPLALQSAAQATTQTTGIVTAFGGYIHPTLGPTWSLTVEWTFYLLFPAVVVWARRRGASIRQLAIGCAVTAVGLYVLALPLDFRPFYLLPVANLGVMCAGAALSFAHREGWQGPSILRTGPGPAGGLFLILVFIVLPGGQLGWAYKLAVLPGITLAALAVVHGIRLGRGVATPVSRPWLVATGVRAYSLYLWHVPVLWLAWRLLPSQPWLSAALAVPLVWVVTEVSFRLLERPVLPGLESHRARGSESVASQ